jgi:23S rRNA (uracil1939-C5)-methyltransferase
MKSSSKELGQESSKSGPEVLLEITDLARSGAGVSRAPDGRVVFVPFTAPGDLVKAKLTKQEKRYAEAELIEVVRASDVRVKAPCPVFTQCGGCQWQHIPYELQWQTKVKSVLQALSRAKIVVDPADVSELPAEQIWNYRNRIQLHGSGVELGFFAPKSHARVSIQSCEIARPELNALLPSVREEGVRLTKDIVREYKVELEVMPDGSTRSMWDASTGSAGFRQIHDDQNEKLRKWVAASITPGRHVYDLFGGSGNLSTAVAPRALSVDCVDVTAPQGVQLEKFPLITFHRSAVLGWTLRQSKKYLSPVPTSAILDPPREGLGEDQSKIATSLEKLNVREIVAVGCDLDSWIRDISGFVKMGWKVEKIGVLDLFPQTAHIESLALLKR